MKTTGQGRVVAVKPVLNGTGDPNMEALCYYLHLKAMQSLGEQGFLIASDALEGTALPLDVPITKQAADLELAISLDQVRENGGTTVKVAFVSAQEKSATADVTVKMTPASGAASTASGSGKSKRGAWGVVARVNRDSMLKGKGFWKVDDSAVGIASSKAFHSAMNKLPLN